MTAVLNGHEIGHVNGKELHSKGIFDRVCVETKKMPESSNSGRKTNLDSVGESDNGMLNTPILSDLPNLYKQNGRPLENLGYFIIPRSVTSDPRYKGARLKYKHILNILFENVAFAPTTHAVGVHIIQIGIGQLCISEDYLAELCNEGVKYEEDRVSGALVHRAIQFWKKCGFVNQQVNHKKNLLTITVPEFYVRLNKRTEPIIEPRPNHDRTTKEEDKELKEDNISTKKAPFVASAFATALLTEFHSSLSNSFKDFPKEKLKNTKLEYQAAERVGKQCNYDMDVIRNVLSYALTDPFWSPIIVSMKKFDDKFVTLLGQMRNKGLKPMNGRKPQPKYNHDTSPSLPSKNISFAE